jgi:hypothetical protein
MLLPPSIRVHRIVIDSALMQLRSSASLRRRDLPNAVVQILQAGHFALDTAANEIALHIRKFIR